MHCELLQQWFCDAYSLVKYFKNVSAKIPKYAKRTATTQKHFPSCAFASLL